MGIIEVYDLRKKLDGKLILDGVSFKVNEGDAFCLLGPNGAGKTTTIRVLMGLYKPDGGSASIKGLDITKHSYEIKRFIGYLPENPSLYERLSVYRNLEFYGKLYDINESILHDRITKLVALLGLKDKLYEKVGRLSKGLRQRVALARALINNPEILILDQPTSDLDPSMAHTIRNFIRILNREHGLTILVCTHNLMEAEDLCWKAALINNGRIIDSGFIEDLKNKLVRKHKFQITLFDSFNKYKPVLEDIDFITRYKVLDDHSIYLYLEDESHISRVIEILVNYGAKIKEVKSIKPRLEDVYLELLRDKE